MKSTGKFLFLIVLLCVLFKNAQAQKMPDEYYFSEDGHMLHIGRSKSTGFYDQDSIQQIRITFPQSNYLTQLTNNYASKTNLIANMTINGKAKDSVGVRYKGMTSYSFIRNSNKKSFAIELDPIKTLQDIKGYTTLNLNNSYADPSFMRDVFYYHNIRRYSMAAKANFAHLYVNDNNYGLYQNVQQYNKDFLSEWFLSNDGSNFRGEGTATGFGGGWGDGNSAFNYKGDDTSSYQTFYTLKSSDQAQPWRDLPVLCKILNQASASTLENDVAPYLDIDRVLWHLAGEVLFSDDDSYIYKGKMDYFLYQDAETGRFMSYDYDANSVMASDHATWSPFYNEVNANYPLMNKLLAVPSIRQRYLAHLRTMFIDAFDVSKSSALIDKYKNLIDSIVSADPIKLSTYTQFNSGVTALKTFIANRRTYLLNHSEFNQTGPVIMNTDPSVNGVAWQSPGETESVNVTTHVAHANGISAVYLYYGTGIFGTFTKIPMYDDGLHNDSAAGDGNFGAVIPAQQGNTHVRFYVEAIANNSAKTASYAPVGAEHDVYIYRVKVTTIGAQNSPVVINEFMAAKSTQNPDEAGEYEDWIELHNKTSDIVDLSGYYLTDNSNWLQKWQFPNGVTIAPNGYLTVWADEDQSQGNTHTNFKLSAEGEQLVLLNKNLQILDSLSFGPQAADVSYARIPNGLGYFIHRQPTTFHANNNVNELPLISITAPLNNTTYIAPATVTIHATASDADGTITQVQFYNGSTLLGSDVSSPYSFTWENITEGSYTISAIASDNNGGISTSPLITITVNNNQLPSIVLTAPSNNTTYIGPATVILDATASDADGTVTQVQFYNGSTLLGSDASSPYNFTWENLTEGSYAVTARATDNNGGVSISSIVNFTITTNQPSVINITSPTNQATINGNSVTIDVSATDPDGSITTVDYFDGTTHIGSNTTQPYTLVLDNAGEGTHVITVRVTDSNGGITISDPVTFTINTSTTSISSNASGIFRDIYPNPTNEAFRIKSSEKIQHVWLKDIYGRQVEEMHDINPGQKVEIGMNVPEGTYILIIEYAAGKTEVLNVLKIK